MLGKDDTKLEALISCNLVSVWYVVMMNIKLRTRMMLMIFASTR